MYMAVTEVIGLSPRLGRPPPGLYKLVYTGSRGASHSTQTLPAATEALRRRPRTVGRQLEHRRSLPAAEGLLLNASRMWNEASLHQRQRLGQLLFPDGLIYADGEVRTRGTCTLFNYLTARRGDPRMCGIPNGRQFEHPSP